MNNPLALAYHVIVPDGCERLHRQWTQSVRSLRAWDGEIDLHLLYIGEPPRSIVEEAERHRVTIHRIGSMAEMLTPYTEHAAVLSRHASIAKIMALPLLPAAETVLLLDCDTFWTAPPGRLLATYGEADLYACHEVKSLAFGEYDPAYLCEDRLAEIARQEGVRFLQPFNIGVMLMRGSLCRRLPAIYSHYLELSARLLAARDPSIAATPLTSPTVNAWIFDQVALWLALGGLDCTVGYFDRLEVLIANQYAWLPRERAILSHYFSGNEEDFHRHIPRLSMG